MNRDFARGTAAGVAACLVAGGLAIAVGAANAQSAPQAVSAATSGVVKACATKKTGALRLLAKGKCKRTERLVTWSQAGPTGPVGPAGPAGAQGPAGAGAPVVRDGDGNVVSRVTSTSSAGITRLVDGGFWLYSVSGALFDDEDQLLRFLGSGCTGQAYVSINTSSLDDPPMPQHRIFVRGQGYRYLDSTIDVQAVTQTSFVDSSGACQDHLMGPGNPLRAIAPIAAPASLPGPLVVSIE